MRTGRSLLKRRRSREGDDEGDEYRRGRWCYVILGILILLTLISLLTYLSLRSEERLCKEGEVFYVFDESAEYVSSLNDSRSRGGCFLKEYRGPCPQNMVLLPTEGNPNYGVCDCGNWGSDRVMLIHHGACYPIFTQGYCREGDWLVARKPQTNNESMFEGVCEPNKCYPLEDDDLSTPEWVVTVQGDCVQLGKPAGDCNAAEVIQFFPSKIYPACRYGKRLPPRVHIGGIGVPSSQCPKGYARTPLGHCALEFDFD